MKSLDVAAICIMAAILIWGILVINNFLWFVLLATFLVVATMFFINRNRR